MLTFTLTFQALLKHLILISLFICFWLFAFGSQRKREIDGRKRTKEEGMGDKVSRGKFRHVR